MKGTAFFSDPGVCCQNAPSRTQRCPQSSLARIDKQEIRERREGLCRREVSAGEKNAVVPHSPSPARLPGITHRSYKTGPWPLLPRLDVYFGEELAAYPLPVGTRAKSTGERWQGHEGALLLSALPLSGMAKMCECPLGQVDTCRWLGHC